MRSHALFPQQATNVGDAPSQTTIDADRADGVWAAVEARFPGWREERHYFHAEGRALKARLRQLLAG